jgi:nucleotide-binding universal stress UspA family protein
MAEVAVREIDSAPRGDAARRRLAGPVLIAGRDDVHLEGALRFGELLARRDRLNAHVLGVVRPVSFPVWTFIRVDPEALEAARRLQELNALRQRVHGCVGRSALFSVDVATGHPARQLAAAASERHSACVLAGLADPGAAERRLTEDDVLEIARASDVPVIAVPSDVTVLPTRAMVAVDFSESSRRAALTTRLVLGPNATMVLVHVAPARDGRVPGQEQLAGIYESGARRLLVDLAAELTGSGDVSIETVLIEGDPADALLEHARSHGFELVACGTQGGGTPERYFAGSLAAALVRAASGAVLLAPPPSVQA